MIGVLGGYGAVGQAAVELLATTPGLPPLLIAGRNLAAAESLVADLNTNRRGRGAAAVRVDLEDARSLREFVERCDVVVNCAGPSYLHSAAVAQAAVMAGVDLIDAGGDERLVGALDGVASRVVLGAGALPGLSGLLPRWLAAEGDELIAYFAVADRFTPVAAADYLEGVLGEGNRPLAGWRAGRMAADVLTRQADVTLPYLHDPVTVFPFLDEEARQVATELQLTAGSWYSVVEGTYLAAALDRSRGGGRSIAEVCRASALDLAGREPRTTFLVQVDGGGRTKTCVLRGPGISVLTGAVAGIATLAVLAGEVPPGAALAATVLDPAATVDRLQPVARVDVLAAAIDDLVAVEEGVL